MGERGAPGRIRTPDQRLRVFISSTLGELAEERRAAREAVEGLRLSPIMFELGARPHPPRALYRSYLEQSDVFVGIYWQRYGWVAPDMAISGLEDEYLLSTGMPRLIYLKRPASDMEPRLADLLRRIEDESSVSYRPFADASELAGLLAEDLALLLTERFDAAVAPTSVAPSAPSLPTPASSFVGRAEVLADLSTLLSRDTERLITLVGPGGTGKTRLALQAASAHADRFADGVYFVDLSEEREPERAYAAIVRALPVEETPEDPPLAALQRSLRDAQMLLLLDNFEQVTAAAAGIVQLLEACPRLRVMVTSREALHVRAERRFVVPPMSLPRTSGRTLPVEVALASEAVRLFCERAAAVQPEFALTDANAADVVAICERLDGLPLAIELAAARVPLFGVDELRARLETHLHVLGRGGHDLPARQQTLRQTLEWSNELLTDADRQLLRLCSLFFDARLTDIEATAARLPPLRSLDVVDGVASLVDKSLVRSSAAADGRPRFSMLQTIRDYATEELDRDPDLAAAARRAHAEHYSQIAAGLRDSTRGMDRSALVALLASELGNLRASWSYWTAEEDVARLNDLLEPLWGFYDSRGNYRVAVQLGEELLAVLSRMPATPERDRDELALEMSLARSSIAVAGFSAEAERRIRDVLQRTEAAGETPERFATLRSLATLHLMRADFPSSAAIAPHLTAIAERQQDPALLSEAHLLTGMTRLWSDGPTAALPEIRQAVRYSEAAAPTFVRLRVGPNPGVLANTVLGLVSWMAGYPDQARDSAARAVEVAEDVDHPYSVGYALYHAGMLDLWREDVPRLSARATALLQVAAVHDYPIWGALARVLRGIATTASGQIEEGLAELKTGFDLYQGLSTPPVFWPILLAMRAAANLMGGRADDAMADIEEGLRLVDARDPVIAELAILQGDAVLAGPSPDASSAAAHYRRALQDASARGLRMSALNAAERLVALGPSVPDHGEALQRLRTLLDAFTEGFDTPHLARARALAYV